LSSNKEQTCLAQILRLNLNEQKGSKEKIDAQTLRKYLGGCALGAKFLYDEVPFNVEWSNPENRLIILGGPLSGTAVPGSGGITVSTRGAMTNGAASTQAQGVFGAYLRSCGLMGLVIQGACDTWTYLVVDEEGSARFMSAEHLVGKDTWETADALAKELGKGEREISVLSIGPAGEKLVRFACIVIDKGHVAAHNGVGAVMGSKKLKAIVVLRGKQRAEVKDRARLTGLVKALLKPIIDNPTSYHYYGTLPGFLKNLAIGNLPVKNYMTSKWLIPEEKLSRFTGPYIREHYSPKRKRPCWACPHHHCEAMTIPEGPYKGMEVEEPDYEQLSGLGSNLGIGDVTDVIVLANLVDRLGMDANETGWVLSCVMECYERGILTKEKTDGLEMTWGNVEAVRNMLGEISKRKGIGDVLAEGVMRAVGKIGHGAEDIGIYTGKGTTPRSHDHRARWTELFDHCVSDSGALDSTPIGPDVTAYGLAKDLNPFGCDPDRIVEMEVKMKGGMQFEDSLVTCRFNTRMNIAMLTEALQAVMGWDFTAEEAMEAGLRAVHLMRVFNIRSGLTSDLDWPSPRYGSAPVDGPTAGKTIFSHFEQILKGYYQGMGWDEKGRPLPETLNRLGLEKVADDLWARS
jgi:aldehyde:ferredoxin oxidoreductase